MARYNKRDRDHPSAVESFNRIQRGDTPYHRLFTSDYILGEAVTGCRQRTRNHKLSVELGTAILSSESIVLLKVDDEVLGEAWELYKARREVALSFTDCTTAVLAKRHGVTDIFTYDEDFQALGLLALSTLGT
jgi:predicted nucleic acid-binding protein